MTTATRYKRLRSRLDDACKAAGRKPEDVLLLAVSKTVDLDQVEWLSVLELTVLGKIDPMNY